MALESRLKAIVIDDEPAARDDLRRLIAMHPGVAVVGEAGRFADAKELLRRGDYDLVLLDVELRGGNGFDLLPDVRPEARTIFVTAHSQYAVRAFEVNALDYLVKPIAPARLEAALRRAGSHATESAPRQSALAPTDLVHVKIGNGTTRFVAVADIAVIESDENYSRITLGDRSCLHVRRTLKSWEDALGSAHFVRVHRTAIINLARYRGSCRQSDETRLLHLDGVGEPVRASFRYLPELRTRLTALGRDL